MVSAVWSDISVPIINPSPANPFYSQFSYNSINNSGFQTLWILISWLLCQKPVDLDLQCFLSRIYPGAAGQGFRFNPLKPNRISRPYHLDESISNLRVVGW